MAQITLKKLLGKKEGLGAVLSEMLTALDGGDDTCWGILDTDGSLLIGNSPPANAARFPILHNGQPLGWVVGEARHACLARLLAFLANQEAEKKSLAAEVLDRYRELNLLYNLSENLAASPQPGEMARLALAEASALIAVDAGFVVLSRPGGDGFEPLAMYGSSCQLKIGPADPGRMVERVLRTGKAELTNSVPASEYFSQSEYSVVSLLCAPLKTEKRVLGALLLVGGQEKQYTAGDLKLLNTVALQTAPAIEIARLYQVAVEKARMERELQMGREVQTSLLPKKMPRAAGWEFAAGWQPAREVSGDYYDFIQEKKGRLGLVIADVTDKGLPAALFSVFTRSSVRASLDRAASPVQGIKRANRLVCQESAHGLFATLFYASLDLMTGELTYVNAGHNPALLYRAAVGQVIPLVRTGMPLGIDLNTDYEQRSVQLDPGDFIVLYTDGITEAIDTNLEEFGMPRLQQVVLEHCGATAQELASALERAVGVFTNTDQLFDDITLLVARRS